MAAAGGDATRKSSTKMKKIGDDIKSIPEKKENLRKAFDSLQSYSASLAAFAIQWKDLEDHFEAIEKSIDDKFKALQEEAQAQAREEEEEDEEEEEEEEQKKKSSEGAAAVDEDGSGPRPELRSLCSNMDAKGLRSYINDNRKDIPAIREELASAIRCAPDPALLVLEAMEGFHPANGNSSSSGGKRRGGGGGGGDGEIQINRRTCINLLERLHLISPSIAPFVRDKAKKLAIDWKAKIPKSGDFALEALGFLQLIASYNLVSDFPLDDVMELFISVSRRKQAADLIRSLGLTDRLPDLIQKLSSKGRQLDAVKFVYAFDMADKFPPVPLLKAYITESKKMAQGVRKKGNFSLQAQNEAIAKEMGALKSVLRAVEEYKLETEYPHEILVKRIAQLEQKKTDKKRTAAAAAASNSKPQQQQQQNKRPRPSSASSAAVIAANPRFTQTHPQLGLADHAYMDAAGLYGLAATGSVYNRGVPNPSGNALGHGATHSPPVSYYSSETLPGTSRLYDRPVNYNGYTLSDLPSTYGSSLYR